MPSSIPVAIIGAGPAGLTAAIDAHNGAACMFTKTERYRQYLHSFRWYMRFLKRHSDLCRGILFCKNSEADLSEFKKAVPEALSDHVEFISLPMEGLLAKYLYQCRMAQH